MTSAIKKILPYVIIALILGAIIGAGVFGIIKIKEKNTGQENFSITTDPDGSMRGIKIISTLLSISSEPEVKTGNTDPQQKAYTLTAIVIPEDAFNQSTDFEFSVAFVNPSSAWASGKNVSDYISTTPQDKNSIIVTCLKPFSEQIKITATSLAIGQSAECTCDYVKNISQYNRPNYGGRDPGYDGLDVIYYFNYTGEGTVEPMPVLS